MEPQKAIRVQPCEFAFGANALSLFFRLLGLRHGWHAVEIAAWIWLGDFRCVAMLAATARNSWFCVLACVDCRDYVSCRERRIVIPKWTRNAMDQLVIHNTRC